MKCTRAALGGTGGPYSSTNISNLERRSRFILRVGDNAFCRMKGVFLADIVERQGNGELHRE